MHHGTTFSPVLTGLTETPPFSSLQGSAVNSHGCVSPAKGTLGEVPKHRGPQAPVVFLCPVLQALLRTRPAQSRLQLPKLGESSSCPGPHSFHRLFPLYIGILAISGPKFSKALRGTTSIFGCSEGLQIFGDARRGCKHFWMLD